MSLPLSPLTTAWFQDSFPEATPVQQQGWPVIAKGEHALLLAPTGSGKTLAAFMVGIDRCLGLPLDAPEGVRVLYVSPLKALVYDVERNLRAPLMGVQRAAPAGSRPVRVDLRTGDTSQRDRRRFSKHPGDILVTTPESLYLLLTSGARECLRTVHTVIIDEIHSIAATKRGVHLALSLERLEALVDEPMQRIGLSATVRPIESVANFLGGVGRAVNVVDASASPRLDLSVHVPVADMEQPVAATGLDALDPLSGGPKERTAGIWPAMHPKLLELIRAHRTTIVFANSRKLTERLCNQLNELAGEEVAKAHHGSISHARRGEIEDDLKAGRIPCIVATSSLELGIDMGAVDLVIQVESPGSSARGLQRVGRAGHQVGAVSRGRIFPKYRGDLLEAVVVAERMTRGELEPLHAPRNCLDVLAQQIVAMVAMEPLTVEQVRERIGRAWPYRELGGATFNGVLDMLSGRYPSEEFGELRPRISWDRTSGELTARRGSRMLAVLNGGTIADRGLFGVFLPDGPRIGELDEEMVYESRVGDLVILGASTWKVEEITRDKVLVSPAPGQPGRMPFWRGQGPGRPIDLGRALGRFLRQLVDTPVESRPDWLREQVSLDDFAIDNLLAYVADQREATGTVPTDRALTVECFRDEIGDWRVCLLTPFGARVHAPWGLAIQKVLSERHGYEVQCMWTDDGIVLRFADIEELPNLDGLFPDPEEIEELITHELRHSSMFASHFRENAGRALLLPRMRPGRRTPLWAQRRKGESLLAVAGKFPSFPVLLETYRECLQDVFDVSALQEVLTGVRNRTIRVDTVETQTASPFARSLVFAWVANFLYEVDTPLAERRAAALTLDRSLLRELLGQEELRELLDPHALLDVETALQGLAVDRQARDADEVHDLLRRLGDLTVEEIEQRAVPDAPVAEWLDGLTRQGRGAAVFMAGEHRWIAAEDSGRYRDALGVMPAAGLPTEFLTPTERPLEGLLMRWARTHGPFEAHAPATRWGLPVAVVESLLRALLAEGSLVEGELRPGGTQREWCHPNVLRRLKRATLARLRDEVAAVEASSLARFLPAWQGLVGKRRHGLDRLREVVVQLEGAALPFSVLEKVILPERVPGFDPSMLDQLGALGELVWVGRGALGRRDGRVVLLRRAQAVILSRRPPDPDAPADGPIHVALVEWLQRNGASFLTELMAVAPESTSTEILGALWDLVWQGRVTNDTFQPLRGLAGGSSRTKRARRVVASAGGRWGLVSRLSPTEPAPTTVAVTTAQTLLERYGVVAREMALHEEIPGGFQNIYKVLKAMEDQGQVRRGYFVEGLGGAQFALPGAVDRLRSFREGSSRELTVLAATDPAQPWGGVLGWPAGTVESARPRRVPGASVVLSDGLLVLFVDRGGKTVWSFSADPELLAEAAEALGKAKRVVGVRAFRVERIDGEGARASAVSGAFLRAGWVPDHKGLNWAR